MWGIYWTQMTKSNQKFYRIYGIWAKHKFIIIPFVWPSHFRFSSASCLRGRLGGRGRNKSGKKRQIICIVEQQAEAECWKLAASWKPYPYSWNVDKSWMYQLGLRYKLFPDADRKHPIFNRFQPAGWPYPVCIFLSQDIALSLTCSYRFHCQVSPTSKRGGQMTTNFPPIVYRPLCTAHLSGKLAVIVALWTHRSDTKSWQHFCKFQLPELWTLTRSRTCSWVLY